MGEADPRSEWLKCSYSASYFVHNYCFIYDATLGNWIPFHLWPEQARALRKMQDEQLIIILKARQLGLTWLVLAFIMWLMVFHPVATGLLFSRRDDEAIYLMSRITGMYAKLPEWMRTRGIRQGSSHTWQLSNDSIAYAFPTTAGDSYTATIAFVDEADLVPDLDRLMNAVKPTIDGGGKMVLLSRVDKGQPNSPFKRIYRSARAGNSPWIPIFMPWFTRPERTPRWYEDQKADILSRTGSLDDLYQQYPATEDEALAARSMDKRIPEMWIGKVFKELAPLIVFDNPPPDIPRLVVYAEPIRGGRYTVGVDPAEGNPTSDDSALSVVDSVTLEEVAVLSGKIEPTIMASHAYELAKYYNNAGILVERNNHGHTVINELRHIDSQVKLIVGWDDREGWMSSSRGKVLLYNKAADVIRDGDTTIHSWKTRDQLVSIEGDTLRAPEGLPDDCADSYSLAINGATLRLAVTFSYEYT